MRMLVRVICIAACASVLCAAAQPYPARPLRLIVPLGAGTGTDLMSRALAQKLAEQLGQQVVVDNRPGAGATIGSEVVARAAPDGYTVLMGGSVSLTISPALYRKVAYDPVRDFAPVALISRFFNLLVVHPSLPVKSVSDLIALARARPGQLLMTSAGSGSTSHLAGELLKSMAKIDLLHVPYRSGSAPLVAVVSGEGHLTLVPVSLGVPFGKSGRLRMLGMTSPQRIAPLPQVPAIAESVPGYEWAGWQGLLVPAATPPELVKRLRDAVLNALNNAEFRDYIAAEGSELFDATPAQFTEYIRAEMTKNANLVRISGARAE
jgi:tripartite-type tricarboxylate transporter receptor subunit TctC